MKKILITLLVISCISCNRWNDEKTKQTWNNLKFPIYCISITSYMDSYHKIWIVDANGELQKIEGYGFVLESGRKYENRNY